MVIAHTLSAIADKSSVYNRGRAKCAVLRQTTCMADDKWRNRIEAAVKKDGRSLRDISLAAGLSHGYLHGILRDDKEPTLDRFIRICQELNVSLAFALMGMEISPETEQIISQIEADEPRRKALLDILSSRATR